MEELCYRRFERTSKSDYPALRDSGKLKEKYLSLVEGLPPQDVALISRQMRGLERIFEDNSPELDIFTNAEKEEYRQNKELLDSNTFQIDKNTWCYRDFLLPSNSFDEISVFIHQHGIEYWGGAFSAW